MPPIPRDPDFLMRWFGRVLAAWAQDGHEAAARVLAEQPPAALPRQREVPSAGVRLGVPSPERSAYGCSDLQAQKPRRPSGGRRRRLFLAALVAGGYRCAYCHRPLLDPAVVGVLAAAFGAQGLFPTGWRFADCHPAVLPLYPALDHIWPLIRAGSAEDPANLAAACWQCNATKGSLFLEELGWAAPVTTRVADRHDGLVPALLTVLAGPAAGLDLRAVVLTWPSVRDTEAWLVLHRQAAFAGDRG